MCTLNSEIKEHIQELYKKDNEYSNHLLNINQELRENEVSYS